MISQVHSDTQAVAWNGPQKCLITGIALEALVLLVVGGVLVGCQISPVGATVTLSLGFLSGLMAYCLIITQLSQRNLLARQKQFLLDLSRPRPAPNIKVEFKVSEYFQGDRTKAFAVRFSPPLTSFYLQFGEKLSQVVYAHTGDHLTTTSTTEQLDAIPYNLAKVTCWLIAMKPKEYLAVWSNKEKQVLLFVCDDLNSVQIQHFGPLDDEGNFNQALIELQSTLDLGGYKLMSPEL